MNDNPKSSVEINSELWVERYGDPMFRFTLARVKDPVTAEEIVQVALVAALQSQNSFAGKSSEKSWLFGILKHKILDHFRSLKNQRTFDLTSDDDSDPYDIAYDPTGHWITPPKDWDTEPEKALENQQLLEALTECLSHLSDKYRNVFVLKEMEGLKSEEICKEFDIQPTNLWVILHRARNQLRQCLESKNWSNK